MKKVEFAGFGVAEKFRIEARWVKDSEPLDRLPSGYGWSVGDLKLFVLGQVITQSRRGEASQQHVSWYLLPVLRWLAKNWVELFHEEDFSWSQKSSASAAIAYQEALSQWVSATDEQGRLIYRGVQGWYRRHALRSASEGGLFPNLFCRRFGDEVELSWTSDAPFFAPKGFSFLAEAGVARLGVDDVAGPLWEFLNWAASVPPQLLLETDLQAWKELCSDVEAIRGYSGQRMVEAYVPAKIYDQVEKYLKKAGHSELVEEDISAEHPYVSVLSPAVAMFGGVSPNLGQSDIEFLCSILIESQGKQDSTELGKLVEDRDGGPLGIPYKDGLSFAEDFLEDIDFDLTRASVDIRSILESLAVRVVEKELETDGIRGVALAGKNFGPVIVINLKSKYNETEAGKRFTLAHELCHILFDRMRAKRVAHVSGPWVAQGIERRANAFAAYFLMPREIVLGHLGKWKFIGDEAVHELSKALEVSESSLIEHLFNLDLIPEWKRDYWRSQIRVN